MKVLMGRVEDPSLQVVMMLYMLMVLVVMMRRKGNECRRLREVEERIRIRPEFKVVNILS
jgi:hypothetical protein